jgi:hypothetical protein
MMKTGRSVAGVMLTAALCWPAMTMAQDNKPSITSKGDAATETFPIDELITKTVHQAWVDSGRNEDKFFAMVQELAELSAKNRGVSLPDTHEAGVKFGDWIKKKSRKDPNQLLYAVVDNAVKYVGKTQSTGTSSSSN